MMTFKTTPKTLEKANKEFNAYNVIPIGQNEYKLTGTNKKGNRVSYKVTLHPTHPKCTCPDFIFRKSKQGLVCKHILIALKHSQSKQFNLQIDDSPEPEKVSKNKNNPEGNPQVVLLEKWLKFAPPQIQNPPEKIGYPPYFPPKVHDVNILQLLYAYWKAKRNILLIGPRGCGKNKAVEIFAKIMRLPLYTASLSTHIDEDALYGYYTMVEGEVKFVDGIITRAARQGGILVLDEINSPENQGVLFPLHSLLDSRRTLYLAETNEEIKARNLFVVATMNPGYQGVYSLNEALVSRFQIIPFEYDIEIDKKILEHAKIPQELKEKWLQFVEKLRGSDEGIDVSYRLTQLFCINYLVFGEKGIVLTLENFSLEEFQESVLMTARTIGLIT